MSKKKNWQEFVNFVRGPVNPKINELMKESINDDLENFLFLANSEDPEGPVIHGMHFPDSELLEETGPTIFETADKNVYIAAYRSSSLLEVLEAINENIPEKLREAVWEKTLETLLQAAEQKLEAGDVRGFF